MKLRKKIVLFFIILALSMGVSDAHAAKKRHKKNVARQNYSLVDRTASYADIVIDAETGRVLHATEADKLRHPASLTKMMTLYLTFQALESGRLGINQYLPVSSNAAQQSPSKLGLRAGQRIRVEDAILGLVTESANDAAVVLAEWMGGSEKAFGQIMTRQAQALGMMRTRFDNPSGLPDPQQVTSARDMAMLGHALIYHFPQFYSYFSRDDFSYAGRYHRNHNRLMERYDGMDGIKTGYIRASGFNLVASAKRGPVRLIGVVFGGKSTISRDNRMAQLLDKGFAMYQTNRVSDRLGNGNLSTVIAQGDSSDDDKSSGNYLPLPAKLAMVYPARGELINDITRDARVKENVIVTNRWGIQIGAYNDPAVGRLALSSIVNSLPQLLGSADPVVQKVSVGDVTMYRARLMSLDQRSAQAACNFLNQRKQTCLTVTP